MSKSKVHALLGLLVVAIVALLVWLAWPRVTSDHSLTVCSFGGTFQESQRKAFFEPFAKSAGISVNEASYSGEYSKIRAMVQARSVAWDVVDVEDPNLVLGASEGMYEAIDYGVVDKTPLMPGTAQPCGVVTNIYSTVLAYDTQVYPDPAKRPKTWQDFWDVNKFPGPRALRRSPRGTLEFALLADGVPPESLYPLDVQRALRNLDKLKPHITVWWESGQQPVQLLASREVVMSSAWSGRIWNAKHINNLLSRPRV